MKGDKVMGQREFYSPISKSVDKVEKATNTIDTNVKNVEQAVNDIKNTDLSNLNDKVGVSSNTDTLFQAVQNMVTGTRFETRSPKLASKEYSVTLDTLKLDVVGSGYLISIRNRDATNLLYTSVIIDGVNVVGTTYAESAMILRQQTGSIVFLHRFNSSLKVNATDEWLDVSYILD